MGASLPPELDLKALRDDAQGLLERVVTRPNMAPGSKAYRAYQLEVDRYISDATNGRFKNLAALNKAMATPAVRGAARSVARGATFNFDDELARVLNVGQAPGGMYSPEGEAEFRQFQRDNPMAAFAGEVLGGAALPVVGLAKPGATLLQSMGRAAGIGAAQAGLSAAGEAGGDVGNRLSNAMLPAMAGGVAGGLIPGLAAAGSVARRALDAGLPEFNARLRMAGSVANAGDLTAAGTTVPAARAGLRQLPARGAAGTRRLADVARTFEAAGRPDIVVGDLTPELQARTVNAVRGNPTLAASADVQALIARGQQAPMRVAEDITAAQRAQGVRPTRPLLVEEQARATQQMRNAVPENFGPVPRVPGPDDIGQMVPATTGLDVTARTAEMRDNLATWADSPAGYGGLRAATPDGVPNLFNELDGPQARLNQLIARNPSRATTRRLSEISENIALLRTGAGQAPNGNVLVDEARDAVGRVNEMLNAGFIRAEDGARVPLTQAEINILKDTRDQITTAMDRRLARTSAPPFSAVNREYAERSARVRAAETGERLANNIGEETTQGVPLSKTAFQQEFEAVEPAFRDEVRLAIASRVLNDLSAAPTATTTTSVVRRLVDHADQAYRGKVALAFPTKTAFRRFLFQAESRRAIEQGADYFAGKSSADIQAFMQQLAVSTRDEATGRVNKQARDRLVREFRTGMLSTFLRQVDDPDGVAKVASLVAGNDPESLRKLRQVFGNRGLATIRERLNAEAPMSDLSRFLGDAARNPAERDRGLLTTMVDRNNPVTSTGVIAGIGRRLLQGPIGRRYQAEMLRLGAMPAGPQNFNQFAQTMQNTVAGANPSNLLTQIGPLALGRGLSSFIPPQEP